MIRDHSYPGRSKLMNQWILVQSGLIGSFDLPFGFPVKWVQKFHIDDTVVLLLECINLVMPRGKFASSNQKHHLDLRPFTVPYFSAKPSRSSAMHYVWPSLVSYELMDGHQSLFSRWRMSHPPSTFDTHHQARLSTYETKIVAHDAKHSISQKNRVLYEQST